MEKRLIPAPIDGKNVGFEWLETIFDDDCLCLDVRLMIGLVNHCAVQCTWDYNTITWQVSKEFGKGEPLTAYMLLEERLKNAESDDQNVYSVIQHGELGKLQLVQTFYFKED